MSRQKTRNPLWPSAALPKKKHELWAYWSVLNSQSITTFMPLKWRHAKPGMAVAENILSDVFWDGAMDRWLQTLNNEDFFSRTPSLATHWRHWPRRDSFIRIHVADRNTVYENISFSIFLVCYIFVFVLKGFKLCNIIDCSDIIPVCLFFLFFYGASTVCWTSHF